MLICIPITETSRKMAKKTMQKSFSVADLVELRADFLKGEDYADIICEKEGEIIVTNRCKEEGGLFTGTETERIQILKKAIALGADFIDIEARTLDNLISEVHTAIEENRKATKLIISYHNFVKTPSDSFLRKQVINCFNAGADIAKIVTTAQHRDDNIRILHLLSWAQGKGYTLIAFCMGEKGRISRIMAPFFGSFLSFATLKPGKESAPGQFTVQEMKYVFRMLNYDR